MSTDYERCRQRHFPAAWSSENGQHLTLTNPACWWASPAVCATNRGPLCTAAWRRQAPRRPQTSRRPSSQGSHADQQGESKMRGWEMLEAVFTGKQALAEEQLRCFLYSHCPPENWGTLFQTSLPALTPSRPGQVWPGGFWASLYQ